jgi:hypothetical protein
MNAGVACCSQVWRKLFPVLPQPACQDALRPQQHVRNVWAIRPKGGCQAASETMHQQVPVSLQVGPVVSVSANKQRIQRQLPAGLWFATLDLV